MRWITVSPQDRKHDPWPGLTLVVRGRMLVSNVKLGKLIISPEFNVTEIRSPALKLIIILSIIRKCALSKKVLNITCYKLKSLQVSTIMLKYSSTDLPDIKTIQCTSVFWKFTSTSLDKTIISTPQQLINCIVQSWITSWVWLCLRPKH